MIDDRARHIAQDILARTGEAISAEDFDLFAVYFALPQELETADGRITVATPQALRQIFDRFQHHLKIKRVTTIERHCISAEFIAPDVIHTTHETRLVTGTSLAEEPYPVFSKIKKFASGWKITFSQTAFPESTQLNEMVLRQRDEKPAQCSGDPD